MLTLARFVQNLVGLACREWLVVEVALDTVYATAGDKGALVFGFYALCHNVKAHVVTKLYHAAKHFFALWRFPAPKETAVVHF